MKKTITVLSAMFIGLSASAMAHGCSDKECSEKKKCDKEKCEEKCAAAFTKHDKDKDGKLSMEEFKALVADCKSGDCDDKKDCDKEGKCEKSEKKAEAPVKKPTTAPK